ncbi:hypothetical protein EIN_053410 [Entamoeba invadens IP1]|uniref:hypothetical protein n=1 Tax=Entamoeba invadens IP1 TaxID=370355 RepID=UPI0002C3D7CE|nr:hypothetical protein EIN_053410 [Entamoeba invadens IP1]ELP93096.1 hypothetical protein EIN_053410 [Entamoeba invadens IP1]|eukprot:XP_004259867.1 hypothetical protein EIN_053410 [Entamoeba invadens IP1]
MSRVVTMRIKFPISFPIIYKTLRVDGDMSVKDSVQFIAGQLHMLPEDGIGLYLPTAKKWLDDESLLETYQDDIGEEENVEYKFKDGRVDTPTDEQIFQPNTQDGCVFL